MEREEMPSYGEELLGGQKPKYLLVCCADSRVPKGELLIGFKFEPGKVFTISNAGNCYLLNLETFYYGVAHLGVERIVICGHNDCGMMKAVVKGYDENPYIQRGIDTIINKVFGGSVPELNPDELAKENVHRQIELMIEDDVVRKAMESGALKTVEGWYYDFSSGKPELYLINRNGEKMNQKLDLSEIKL